MLLNPQITIFEINAELLLKGFFLEISSASFRLYGNFSIKSYIDRLFLGLCFFLFLHCNFFSKGTAGKPVIACIEVQLYSFFLTVFSTCEIVFSIFLTDNANADISIDQFEIRVTEKPNDVVLVPSGKIIQSKPLGCCASRGFRTASPLSVTCTTTDCSCQGTTAHEQSIKKFHQAGILRR